MTAYFEVATGKSAPYLTFSSCHLGVPEALGTKISRVPPKNSNIPLSDPSSQPCSHPYDE